MLKYNKRSDSVDDFAEKEGGSSEDKENTENKKRAGNVKSHQRPVSKGKTAAAKKRTRKRNVVDKYAKPNHRTPKFGKILFW